MNYALAISFDTSLSSVKNFIKSLQRSDSIGTLWKSQCWIWPYQDHNYVYNGRSINPLDFMFLAFKGPVASNDKYKHRCKNKRCVNPLHFHKVRKRVYKRGLKAQYIEPILKQRGSLREYPEFDHDHFWNTIRQEGYHLIPSATKYMIKGISVKPIRLAYMLRVGDIPDGYKVVVKCENPNCVDPYHCELEQFNNYKHEKETKP